MGVYERLRADVRSCWVAPGRKLNIAEFPDELGMSSGAVREALARLISEALVVVEAQRGSDRRRYTLRRWKTWLRSASTLKVSRSAARSPAETCLGGRRS